MTTYQCRSFYERVEHIEDGMLCTPSHRLRRLFPTGETNLRRRGNAFLTKGPMRAIPPLYATESVELADKQLLAHLPAGRDPGRARHAAAHQDCVYPGRCMHRRCKGGPPIDPRCRGWNRRRCGRIGHC
jgi:hypothetical protein